MKSVNKSYISSRVLKINVGFLLSGGPGHSHDSVLDFPAVRVDDDLIVDYVRGPLRLSRTAEGILVQGKLDVGVEAECIRCLEPVTINVTVDIEELYSYPPTSASEFTISEDANLDLAPLLRAEVLIQTSRGVVCRDDCKGLCPECGANLNETSCDCNQEQIDPRLAQLKHLLK